MKGPTVLENAEDNLQTDMGAWFPGERVVLREKDLFNELNNLSWFKYLMFGITGKVFTDEQISLFEAVWTLTVSYPDPRLWNNRVAALTGTANSSGILGTSAAIAVSEANTYGNQVGLRAINFIKRAAIINSEDSLTQFIKSEIKEQRSIPGYGRPIVQLDERIQPLLKKAEAVGLSNGIHLRVAQNIETILIRKKYRIRMNAAGLIAALLADIGLSDKQYYYYTALAFSAGIIPCHIDSANKKEGTFFPLRCNRLNYTGPEARHW
jgi:citrate synthase